MTDHDEQAWREEQEFYQELREQGVLTHDEAQTVRSKLPLALVKKMLGHGASVETGTSDPVLVRVPHIDFETPSGKVYRLTIHDDGRARTDLISEPDVPDVVEPEDDDTQIELPADPED